MKKILIGIGGLHRLSSIHAAHGIISHFHLFLFQSIKRHLIGDEHISGLCQKAGDVIHCDKAFPLKRFIQHLIVDVMVLRDEDAAADVLICGEKLPVIGLKAHFLLNNLVGEVLDFRRILHSAFVASHFNVHLFIQTEDVHGCMFIAKPGSYDEFIRIIIISIAVVASGE